MKYISYLCILYLPFFSILMKTGFSIPTKICNQFILKMKWLIFVDAAVPSGYSKLISNRFFSKFSFFLHLNTVRRETL